MASEIKLAQVASGTNTPKSRTHTHEPPIPISPGSNGTYNSPQLHKRQTVIEKTQIHEHSHSHSQSHEETDHLTKSSNHKIIIPSPLPPTHQSPESHQHTQYPDTKIAKLSIDDARTIDHEHSVEHSHTVASADTKARFKEWQEIQKQKELAEKLGNVTPMASEEEIDTNKVLAAAAAMAVNLQNDPFYGINRRHLRAYVRQDWHTFGRQDGLDELRAGWVELFFDLVFVACIVHLSAEVVYSIGSSSKHRRLAEETDYNGYDHDYDESSSNSSCHDGDYDFLLTCFAQFLLLSSFWQEQVMYTTHFVLNAHIDELIRLFYMMFVLAMGIFIADDNDYHIGFFLSYACLRVVSLFMYLRVYYIPRAKAHAMYHIILHCVIVCILIVLIALRYSGCRMDYFVIYVSLFVVEYGSGVFQWTLSDIWCKAADEMEKQKIALPLNVPHISERYGLFVMIILGEALIAVMTADIGTLDLSQFAWKEDGSPPDLLKVFFFLGIFVLSYCIGRLYYGCQPSEEAILHGLDTHALRINKTRARLYIHSHTVLFAALLGYGIGIKLASKHVLSSDQQWMDILLPGYSLVVIIICLNIIRAAHPNNADYKIWAFRLIILCLLTASPILAQSINQMYIWLLWLFCVIALVATDVESEQKRRDEKHHQSERRHAAKVLTEQKQKEEQMREEQDKKHQDFRHHLRHMKSGIGIM